jgi:hypothetical protein
MFPEKEPENAGMDCLLFVNTGPAHRCADADFVVNPRERKNLCGNFRSERFSARTICAPRAGVKRNS